MKSFGKNDSQDNSQFNSNKNFTRTESIMSSAGESINKENDIEQRKNNLRLMK